MKKLAVLLVAGAVAVAVGMPTAHADSRTKVKIRQGGIEFVFEQHDITVRSGATVVWQNRTPAPHTISVVAADEVPRNRAEYEACGRLQTPICLQLAKAHDPDLDFAPPFHYFVNTGQKGFDGRGDSRLLFPGGVNNGVSISADITAPAGSTLHYICAIHPFMNGVIHVE